MAQRSDFGGKIIVITGASSGFGKGAALEFARQGASLVLAARRDQLLEEIARQCQAEGGRALPVPTDVSRRQDMEELTQAALGQFGRIDVWINNAGVGAFGRFESIPLEDHAKVIETDLLGTLYGSYLAYRQFLAQGEGILINVSSEVGKHTVPYFASYVAAKHGVVGLSQTLRQEIEQNKIQGVHVCLMLPTAHDTPFFDHAAHYTGHEVQAPKPLHDPQKVVDALVRLARNPKDEKIVGADGIVKILLKKLAPAAAEKMGAKQMHKTIMEDAPPGADSSESVQAPVEKGRGVRGGRLEERRH